MKIIKTKSAISSSSQRQRGIWSYTYEAGEGYLGWHDRYTLESRVTSSLFPVTLVFFPMYMSWSTVAAHVSL